MKKLIALIAASLLSIGAVMAADAEPAAKEAPAASETVVEEGVAVDSDGDAVETETIIEGEGTDADSEAAPAADEKEAPAADEKADTEAK